MKFKKAVATELPDDIGISFGIDDTCDGRMSDVNLVLAKQSLEQTMSPKIYQK